MNRRAFVGTVLAAGVSAAAPPRSKMGLATTCFMTQRRPKDSLEFLTYCDSLGAGGVQMPLTSLEPAYLKKLREQAERTGLFIEVMAALPRQGDPAQFEKTLSAAREVGALCARIGCLSGRRYETFSTLDQWKKFVGESKNAVKVAVSVADKQKFPLALENHKDWTAEEMVALLKEFSSEYLGALVDTGNNVSLLDDAYDVVDRLAPYAQSTHIKDMGLAEYPDGFLLAEVPLGAGCLDMGRIVATLQRARPKTRMTLEMITRNPLEVPCLTDKYWVTFQETRAHRLAAALRLARTKAQKLPRMDTLTPDGRLQWEEDNVKQCLHYGREKLGL